MSKAKGRAKGSLVITKGTVLYNADVISGIADKARHGQVTGTYSDKDGAYYILDGDFNKRVKKADADKFAIGMRGIERALNPAAPAAPAAPAKSKK